MIRGSLAHAHRRLQHLYEISKLLTRFDSLDEIFSEVIRAMTGAMPLHSAILILETDGGPRMLVWQAAEEGSPHRLRAAKTHAESSYAYLAGATAKDRPPNRPERDESAEKQPAGTPPHNLVILPLALAERPIFGALQIEGAAQLDELDLIFINSVVNQLAVALDRQDAIEAREAATEARRLQAEHRQIAAEAGRVRAEREGAAARAEKVEAQRTKEAARVDRDVEARRRAAAERAEQRTRNELDFARAVTGSLGEGVVAVDIDRRVTLLNAAAAHMLGWTEEQALGKLADEVVQMRRDDGQPITADECPFQLVMTKSVSTHGGEQLFAGRGGPFAVAYTCTALRRGGKLSGAVLAFQDITSRKRAHEATARLAAIVMSSDDAIISKDLRGVIQTWNQGATHLFGYTADEAIGRRIDFLMPPGRDVEGLELLERARRGETLEHYETERRRKDGSLLDVSLTVSPIRDAEGRVIGASIIARDITYLKEAEAARKRADTEQRLLAEVATIVASSLDRRATLAAVARSVVPLFADLCLIDEVTEEGATERREVVFADEEKQRTLGDRVRRFTPGPGWRTPQAKALESATPLFVPEITDPLRDGVAQNEAHAEVMRASGVRSMIVLPLCARTTVLGVLTFVVGDSGRRYSAHDLTLAEEVGRRVAAGLENSRLYEEAQRAIRAREELLAIVSHDLKNPLGVIIMSAALMEVSGHAERRRARKHIEAIQRSAARMHHLIQDLLDTASIEAGGLSLERRRLAVFPLIHETIEAMQSLAASKSLVLRIELPPDLPDISADAGRLQQVFANLLGNAIKFTPDGGTISVRAELADGDIRFSVSDTGAGIPEKELPHLFERFWQVRRTARRGTGLGLSIAKGIVVAHGGRIWVESRLGAGSTFFFTLPAVRQLADEPAEAGMAPAADSGETLHDEIAKQSMELQDLTEDSGRHELDAALEATRVARELAEHTNRIGQQFIDRGCHQLRGPLTEIELFLESLARDDETATTPYQERVIRRMLALLARVTTTIESLRQHVLIEGGRLTPQPSTFDVQQIAADVVERLRPLAEDNRLALELATASNTALLTSDPDLVRLILFNLVGNAIELTERGHIEASVESAGEGCTIAVRVAGRRLPARERRGFFEPLRLIREVTAALGGHVGVQSQAGQGRTFTITLPAFPRTAQQEHHRSLH